MAQSYSRVLLGRSKSETNLEINMKEYEDIRLTWRRRVRKRAILQETKLLTFGGLKEMVAPEDKSDASIPASFYTESEPFELSGIVWTMKVYPFGYDENSGCLAIRLCNKSQRSINAFYSISIKKTPTPDAELFNMWVDPEVDSLVFRKDGHHDAEWGVDDFIELGELYDPANGFYENDQLHLYLQMDVYGDERLANRPMEKAIEEGRTDKLMSIADADLAIISKATKGGQQSLEEMQVQQDRILRTLNIDDNQENILQTTTTTVLKSIHKHESVEGEEKG